MRNLQITSAITNQETTAVALYFNEIAKVRLLSLEEEAELTRRIKQGDKVALDKLVRANLRFVVSVAKKYQYQGLPLSDLINEGNLGLIKAAQRFDATRGFKFISFAVWWIRQTILAAIVENARPIRLPMNVVNQIGTINKAANAIEQKMEREASREQIAEQLNIEVFKVRETLLVAPWTYSYDRCINEEGDTLLDTLTAEGPGPDQGLLADSQRQEIRRMLDLLSGQEQRVLELFYGLTGERELSPPEIARVMQIYPEKVRQLRNAALLKLKERYRANRSKR